MVKISKVPKEEPIEEEEENELSSGEDSIVKKPTKSKTAYVSTLHEENNKLKPVRFQD